MMMMVLTQRRPAMSLPLPLPCLLLPDSPFPLPRSQAERQRSNEQPSLAHTRRATSALLCSLSCIPYPPSLPLCLWVLHSSQRPDQGTHDAAPAGSFYPHDHSWSSRWYRDPSCWQHVTGSDCYTNSAVFHHDDAHLGLSTGEYCSITDCWSRGSWCDEQWWGFFFPVSSSFSFCLAPRPRESSAQSGKLDGQQQRHRPSPRREPGQARSVRDGQKGEEQTDEKHPLETPRDRKVRDHRVWRQVYH